MLEITPEVLDEIQKIYGGAWTNCLYCRNKEFDVYIIFEVVTGNWAVHACEDCLKERLTVPVKFKKTSIQDKFYLKVLGKC